VTQEQHDRIYKLLSEMTRNPLVFNGDKKELLQNISETKSDVKHILKRLDGLACSGHADKLAVLAVDVQRSETKIERAKLWGIMAVFSVCVSVASLILAYLRYVN